jgi:tRNA U55 pseudouridine synthase TruB
MVSMADALKDMNCFIANDELTRKISHGNIITPKDISTDLGENQNWDQEGRFKVLNMEKKLIAILSFDSRKKSFKYNCVFNN